MDYGDIGSSIKIAQFILFVLNLYEWKSFSSHEVALAFWKGESANKSSATLEIRK